MSEYIKDEDVVRPSNHRYIRKEDRLERGFNNWFYKSKAGHQTYGTCDICFDSGPVVTECRNCKQDQVYQVFQLGEVELDSTTLAKVLERGLKVQYAHQEYDWEQPETRPVTVKFLQVAVGYDRILTEPKREEIFNNLYDMLPLDPRCGATQKYIIRDYHPSTYELEYIKDKDVVRPFNHKYTTSKDWGNRGVDHWLYRSMAMHQTYGTCDKCFDSGPVMVECRFCNKEEQVYQVFMFGNVELDSSTFAKRLGREVLPQEANREFYWKPPKARSVTVPFLQTAVGFDRSITEKEREVFFNNLYEMLPTDTLGNKGIVEEEGMGSEKESDSDDEKTE